MRSGQPDPSKVVLPELEQSNFRNRTFHRICESAGLGHRAPKDLRDTYASHLVSAGVPLAYVAAQLGHSKIDVTAGHYARWVRDAYREPPRIGPGEVPADLLTRLGTREPMQERG